MDAKLLRQLKTVTYKYKALSNGNISYAIDDIQKRIDELASNLFKLKVEKITDCITYTHQKNIFDSINDLAQIILMLIKEQKDQEQATNLAMKNKDKNMYFSPAVESRNRNFTVYENIELKNAIQKIIIKRKNDYINSFGYYIDEKSANIIIKKEFDDVSNYLYTLLKINELIKYNPVNNYDPLINGCQNLLYELSQLVIALIDAEESKIVNTIKNPKMISTEGYFLIMDFVNSSNLFYKKWHLLADNIKSINKIFENKNSGLLCKMDVHKQDEVHGVYIGDINKLIEIIENEIIADIRIAYGKFDIFDQNNGLINIVDSVYDNPFVFGGIPTWKARERLIKEPILIRSNK